MKCHYRRRIFQVFGNKIPREGTETTTSFLLPKWSVLFGNKIPREGTETPKVIHSVNLIIDLEIRYPERGRKPCIMQLNHAIIETFKFGNKIPREGTETIILISLSHSSKRFGNKIPREGTETKYNWRKYFFPCHLEISVVINYSCNIGGW